MTPILYFRGTIRPYRTPSWRPADGETMSSQLPTKLDSLDLGQYADNFMEKKMETTLVWWGYIGVMENRLETTMMGLCGV